MLVPILVILGCVALSALFSGAETALTGLGRHGAQQLVEEDPRRNRALKLWIEQPYRALTAILVGNNLANITASSLAAKLSEDIFPDGTSSGRLGLGITIGVMTFLILTFGEITPKTFAKAFATRIAVRAIKFVRLSYFLFFPIVWPMVHLTRAGLKVTGTTEEQQAPTADDIEFMVNLTGREGSLDAAQQRLLTSVFEFEETTVKECMVPRVDVIAVDQTVNAKVLLETLVQCGHSRIPVYHDNIDHIVGMFYAKDILKYAHEGRSLEDFRLDQYLRAPVFVPESKKLDSMLDEFRQRRIHLAVAVDEFGGTAGVVTLEDIIEQFFGEIQDEFDREEPLIQELDNGSRLVAARIDIEELAVHLGIEFPDDNDYESLGGFMSECLGELPEVGKIVTHSGYRFTVTKAKPTHVVQVRVDLCTAAFLAAPDDDEQPDDHTTAAA